MQKEIETWPDLAIGLYDALTGRGAEITYEFRDMKVGVPRTAEPNAALANWKVDGTVRIRTRNQTDS